MSLIQAMFLGVLWWTYNELPGGAYLDRPYAERARTVVVTDPSGDEHRYAFPRRTRLLVEQGQQIDAGTQLNEGSLYPHDLLTLRGRTETEQYFVAEVQKVYKSQGVDIDDKHIELIVRQMMKKVRVDQKGDTGYLPGALVDRFEFRTIGREVRDSRPTLVFAFTPRRETPRSGEEAADRITRILRGRLFIDEEEKRVARLEASNAPGEDAKVSTGVKLASLATVMDFARVAPRVWLPRTVMTEGTARVFFFRTVRVRNTGTETVPNLVVTVDGFGYRTTQPGVADPQRIPPELLKEMYLVGNRKGHYRAFLNLLRNAETWEAATMAYSNIRIPVLLLWDARDWSRPHEREHDRQIVPSAKMATVENGGHFLPLDRPDAVIEHLLAFHAPLVGKASS